MSKLERPFADLSHAIWHYLAITPEASIALEFEINSILDELARFTHPDVLEEACLEDCGTRLLAMIEHDIDWNLLVQRYVRRHIDQIKRDLGSDYEPLQTGDD